MFWSTADEPSSGMDPEARRQMWDVITEASKKQSLILTTHNMVSS
jgi:ATP-binding cassette, subfamily A (ABC1), member 3